MSTIPTPFIGGSDSARPDWGEKKELEAPCFSDSEGTADESAATAPDQKTAAGPPPPRPAPEPETSDYEGPVPVQNAAAEPEPAVGPEEDGLPDFLVGPDSGTPVPSPGAPPGMGAQAPETLARKAEELLDGPHGDRIRQLVADLGSSAAEISIPRAFAAGFLAAQDGEEN